MSVRGNSGFIDTDKRFGSIGVDTKGIIAREQHFLERTQGRFVSLLPPNPTVWYDANPNYITLSGGNVDKWSDRTSNGINATGSTNDPLYITIDSNFNNLPSVKFESSDWLESLDNVLLDCSNGFTVYFVTKIDSFPSTFSVLAGFMNSTSWTQGWGLLYYSSNWRFFVNNWNDSNTRVDMGSWSNFTNPHIFKLHYDRVNIKGQIIGPSSVAEITKAYSTVVTNPSGEGIRIGDGNSSTYQINATFGEILFYNSPLTSSEQLQAEVYLKDKFNIS